MIPSPTAAPPFEAERGPASSISLAPSPHYTVPWKRGNGQSTDGASDTTHHGGSRLVSKKIIVIAGLTGVLILLVGAGIFLCGKGKKNSKRHELYQNSRGGGSGISKYGESSQSHNNRMMERGDVVLGAYPRKLGAQSKTDIVEERNLSSLPLQPSPPNLPIDKPIVKPVISGTPTTLKRLPAVGSVTSYNIASLQQFTKRFSQENFMGQGMLGTVYKGKLPNGKVRLILMMHDSTLTFIILTCSLQVIAIKKLDTLRRMNGGDDEFLQLVSDISKLQHQNIVELVGFCSEYGQRLLVYNFYKCGTLHDALHVDDNMRKTLSWNMRIRIALGSAKALE